MSQGPFFPTLSVDISQRCLRQKSLRINTCVWPFMLFMNWYTWFQGIVLLTYSYVRAQFVGAMGSLSLGLCCPSPVLIPLVYIYIYIYIYLSHIWNGLIMVAILAQAPLKRGSLFSPFCPSHPKNSDRTEIAQVFWVTRINGFGVICEVGVRLLTGTVAGEELVIARSWLYCCPPAGKDAWFKFECPSAI
jgi:hypothetical protein